jgi:hypothetical protein
MSLEVLGARITTVHDAPPTDANVYGARFTVVHDAPSGTPGFQSVCVRLAEGDEQRSGLMKQRGFWRYGE